MITYRYIILAALLLVVLVTGFNILAQGMAQGNALEEQGEGWMRLMMGDRHEEIEKAIRGSAGEEGLQAMRERMGFMMGNLEGGVGVARWRGGWGMGGMMNSWGWPGMGPAVGGVGAGLAWIVGLALLIIVLLYPVVLVLGIKALWLWLKKHQ